LQRGTLLLLQITGTMNSYMFRQNTWSSSRISVQSFVSFHIHDDGHKLGRYM